jgi:hypothetical protein
MLVLASIIGAFSCFYWSAYSNIIDIKIEMLLYKILLVTLGTVPPAGPTSTTWHCSPTLKTFEAVNDFRWKSLKYKSYRTHQDLHFVL